MKNIFLIGFMGCGKSTVAAVLKRDYQLSCMETDEEIVRQAGMSIPEIFDRFGEERFRAMETAVLRGLTGAKGQVISCGGGAAMREENVRLMKQAGTVVLLTARADTVLARTAGDKNRPLLRGRRTTAGVEELMRQRRPHYEAAADLVIATDGKQPEQIAAEIIAAVS